MFIDLATTKVISPLGIRQFFLAFWNDAAGIWGAGYPWILEVQGGCDWRDGRFLIDS